MKTMSTTIASDHITAAEIRNLKIGDHVDLGKPYGVVTIQEFDSRGVYANGVTHAKILFNGDGGKSSAVTLTSKS